MKQHLLYLLVLALLTGNIASGQTGIDCTPNESWIAVGGGLPGGGLLSTEMNGDLYVLHRIQGSTPLDSNRFRISRWNGSTWKRITDFRTTDNGYPTFKALKSYNGALYLGGTFTSFNGNTAMGALVRWDGSTWSSTEGMSDVTAVHAIEIHNGKLYISTEDVLVNGHILQWNGTAWDNPGDLPAPVPHHGIITTLLSWNGSLYAGGAVNAPSDPTPVALKWDGSTWTSLGNTEYGSIAQLFVYHDTLFAAGTELSTLEARSLDLIKWDGNAWQVVPPGSRRRQWDTRYKVHNGELYALIAPDPSWPKLYYRNIDRFDGTNWSGVSNTDGSISEMGEYNGELFIIGSFSASCSGSLDNVAMLCNAQNCGSISGTVYNEFNGNCIMDLDERRLAGRIIRISPGDQYAMTDRDGKYSRYVLNGDYTVALTPYTYWDEFCPASPGTYQVSISGPAGASGINFGTRPIPGIQDLRVSIAAGSARPGRQLTYAITYQNAGTVTMNGTARLLLDSRLHFDSADVPSTRFTPNAVEWNFTNLAMEEARTIHVWTTVPVATTVGTKICSEARIDPVTTDNASIDNRDSVCVAVTSSYDPNDIRITPFGVADDGVITRQDSILTYRVRFQNTGNDTAFNVVVIDSLSPHVDLSSIRPGAASHAYSLGIDKSNVLVWTFNNILLPDSGASETNSHGFFTFSVKLKPDLPAGTAIPNRAHIFFDYNDPVATNTVVSILDPTMGVEMPAAAPSVLSIYPNPAHQSATIGAELRTGSSVTLRNLLGETLRIYRYTGNGVMTIDLRELPAGTYLVTAETRSGVLAQPVTVY